jgi:hypothetical protein
MKCFVPVFTACVLSSQSVAAQTEDIQVSIGLSESDAIHSLLTTACMAESENLSLAAYCEQDIQVRATFSAAWKVCDGHFSEQWSEVDNSFSADWKAADANFTSKWSEAGSDQVKLNDATEERADMRNVIIEARSEQRDAIITEREECRTTAIEERTNLRNQAIQNTLGSDFSITFDFK